MPYLLRTWSPGHCLRSYGPPLACCRSFPPGAEVGSYLWLTVQVPDIFPAPSRAAFQVIAAVAVLVLDNPAGIAGVSIFLRYRVPLELINEN